MLYLGITFYLIFGALLKKESKAISVGGWLFLFFWLIYSIRLFYDIQIRGIVFSAYSLFKFYTLAYGSGFFAALATILTTKYINLKTAKKYFYYTIFASNISIIMMVLYLYKSLNPLVIAARVQFSLEIDKDTVINNVLNPITIGFHGELLCLVSLYFLLFEKSQWLRKKIYQIGFFSGFYVLIIGGSKGPLVSFFILSFFLVLLNLYHSNKTKLFYFKLLTIPIVSSLIFIKFIIPRIPWEHFTIFSRMKSWITDDYQNSLDNRDEKFEYAWQEFIEHPIIGSRYIDQFNSYPHNLFLEALMALGILGGSFFFILIIHFLIKTFFDIINEKRIIIFSLLVLSSIFMGMTSGSLFASYQFWIVLAFYLSINNKQKRLI